MIKHLSKKSFIEPRGVVTRQSTDVLAIADADVAAAVRVIREQACTGIDVAEGPWWAHQNEWNQEDPASCSALSSTASGSR